MHAFNFIEAETNTGEGDKLMKLLCLVEVLSKRRTKTML
jgi:hypothetical protein